MKLAIVVQRYGAEHNGGAELNARYVAEHLNKHGHVEVLSTCASDYITWRNHFKPGLDSINGVSVRRFPVSKERNPADFGRRSEKVFQERHSFADELAWLSSEGPTSPALVKYLKEHEDDYDYHIFFSYRYYHAYHGIRALPNKAILVPTAERDPALGLSIFRPIFLGVRALMYNSFEERSIIQNISGNNHVPGVVVGVGSEIPPRSSAQRFRQNTGLKNRFAIYVGRIDQNKGCDELFRYFQQYAKTSSKLDLVLIGNPVMEIPSHPRIHHLGFLSDTEKFDAMSGAELLIMPSYYESLSMVTIEAWAMGLPVLVNGACDVLHGQVIRSSAGLYYTNYEEFSETLKLLERNRELRLTLGRNGRKYFQENYSWPVIERKYLETFDHLKDQDKACLNHTLEPAPGWFSRYRRNLAPSSEILEQLPKGPAAYSSNGHDQTLRSQK